MDQRAAFIKDWIDRLSELQGAIHAAEFAPARDKAAQIVGAVSDRLVEPDNIFEAIGRDRSEAAAIGRGMVAGAWGALNPAEDFSGFTQCCAFTLGIEEACQHVASLDDRQRILGRARAWLCERYLPNGQNNCCLGISLKARQLIDDQLAEIADAREAQHIGPDDGASTKAVISNMLGLALADAKLIVRRDWALSFPLADLEYSNPTRIAVFEALAQYLAAPLSEGGLARAYENIAAARALYVAELGMRDTRAPAWCRRVAALDLSEAAIALLDPRSRQCLEHASALLIVDNQARGKALWRGAESGSLLSAIYLLGQGIDADPPEALLALVETVLASGGPYEKEKAAAALRNIATMRARELEAPERDRLLARLVDVETRLFAMHAARAGSGDRSAMLALAAAFELGKGVPATGDDTLSTGWREAAHWRRKVFTRNEAEQQNDAARDLDDLDRRALRDMAQQHLDGRGVMHSEWLASDLLRRAAVGTTPTALAAALDLARIEINEVLRQHRSPHKKVRVKSTLQDRAEAAFANLDKALRGNAPGAHFLLGQLLAQPWGDAWQKEFLPERLHAESPGAAYLEEMHRNFVRATTISPAAQALFARHLLGRNGALQIPASYLDGIAHALTIRQDSGALTTFANDRDRIGIARQLGGTAPPASYLAALVGTPGALHMPGRHAAWVGEMLRTLEARGLRYDDPIAVQVIQLETELADLEDRLDAPLWSTLALRASIRANAHTLAPRAAVANWAAVIPDFVRRACVGLINQPTRIGTLAARVAAEPLTAAEAMLDQATRAVGPQFNVLDDVGVPLIGRHQPGDGALLRFKRYSVDFHKSQIILRSDGKPAPRDAMLSLADVFTAAALCLGSEGPSFSLEAIQDFDIRFLNPGMPRHISAKEWRPTWLGETDFGRTMYLCDYMLSIDTRGRDLFSLTDPFVTAETRPGWSQPAPWHTAHHVGGLVLTRSSRVALVPKQITEFNVEKGKNGARLSITIPHCNVAIHGAGKHDTPAKAPGERNIGEGDIRVDAARSPYYLSTQFPEMVRALPAFARMAYLSATFFALREAKQEWLTIPGIENRLSSWINRHRLLAARRQEAGDLGFVIQRGV